MRTRLSVVSVLDPDSCTTAAPLLLTEDGGSIVFRAPPGHLVLLQLRPNLDLQAAAQQQSLSITHLNMKPGDECVVVAGGEVARHGGEQDRLVQGPVHQPAGLRDLLLNLAPHAVVGRLGHPAHHHPGSHHHHHTHPDPAPTRL